MENVSAEQLSPQPQTVYNHNQLTGLLFPSGFMETVRTFLPKTAPDTCCMVAIDILHFRLFNKYHGRDVGDRLLRSIAGCLEDIRERHDLPPGPGCLGEGMPVAAQLDRPGLSAGPYVH